MVPHSPLQDLELSGWSKPFDSMEARALVAMLRVLARAPKWEAHIHTVVKAAVLEIQQLTAAAVELPDHEAFWLAVASLCFIGK